MSSPPSAAEDAMIAELRENLSSELASCPNYPELTGDGRLLRFLRGHDTLEKAADAYKTMLKIRAENGVDKYREVRLVRRLVPDRTLQMLSENGLDPTKMPHFDEIQKALEGSTMYDVGQTKEGDLVDLSWMGLMNFEIALQTSVQKYREAFFYVVERKSMILDEESRKQGRLVRVVTIRSGKNVGMGVLKFAKNIFGPIMKDIAACYPEIGAKTVIIDPPAFFSLLIGIVTPFMNDKQKAKLWVIQGDYKPELMPIVGPSILEHLVSKDFQSGSVGGEGEGSIVAPAWGSAQIPITVAAGDIVGYSWSSNGDVKFSVTILSGSAEDTAVKPVVLPENTHCGQGECEADCDGFLCFIFDNSAAWVNSYTVKYNVVKKRA